MSSHTYRYVRLMVTLLLFTFSCTCVRAQIRISRQVIAAAVFSATPDGTDQRLKMTATAGEVFIGTRNGDIRATVGFQQPDDDVLVAVVTLGGRPVMVRAFPNPAIDLLHIDLTEARGELTEIMLLDLLGRPVLRRAATTTVMEIPEISHFAGGTYFLRGLDRNGQAHALGAVIIAPH